MRTSAALRRPESGVRVTEAGIGGVGLGTAPTARADSSPAGRARLEAVVARAVERGIEWIDTAGIYGLGTTERAIGAALAGIDSREWPAVATKCGLRWDAGAERAVAVGAAEVLRGQALRSCESLGASRLDLLLLHRPPEDGTPLEAAWTVLAELAAEGIATCVGLSGCTAGEIARCHAERPVDAVQAPLSLVRRETIAGVVASCRARGIPAIAHGALETGLLRAPGGALPAAADRRRRSPLFGAPERVEALVAGLDAIARDVRCTPAELAVAWPLTVPGVVAVAAGASEPAQVDGWASAGRVGLDEAARDAIDALVAAQGAHR